MLRQSQTRLVPGARSLSTTLLACASHYDVLGVTPKSTQSEIKTAYYKLSKVHHPDKSTDDASAKKFRAITEAYEVLGNVKLKRMYDKGLLVGRENTSHMAPEPEREETDPSLRFYKSRSSRNVIPTMDGKTPIYNFDAWAKNHYSAIYEKSQYEKEFVKQKRKKMQEASSAHQQETVMFLVFVLGAVFIVLVLNGTTDYDKVNNKESNTSNQENKDVIQKNN